MNKIGNKNIVKKMFGNKEVLKEVLNGSVVYSAEEELLPYVMFSSLSYFTIVPSAYIDYDGTLEYSKDKSTWNTWTYQSVPGTLDDGLYKVYIRGLNNTYVNSKENNRSCFKIEDRGDIYISGNINSLLDYRNKYDSLINVSTYTFKYMFYGQTAITDVGNLLLPANTLIDNCYSYMFKNCSGLINTPNLSATTLAQGCYSHMFEYCTSLTTISSLPATILAVNCYNSMFSGCSSLETLPSLPATTLRNLCYANMFFSCYKIKLSTTQTAEYQTSYRIPTSGTGEQESDNCLNEMFSSTGGFFAGTPTINTTYYTSNTIV